MRQEERALMAMIRMIGRLTPNPPAEARAAISRDLEGRVAKAYTYYEEAWEAGDMAKAERAFTMYLLRHKQYVWLRGMPERSWCLLCQPNGLPAEAFAEEGEYRCIEHRTQELTAAAQQQAREFFAEADLRNVFDEAMASGATAAQAARVVDSTVARRQRAGGGHTS